MSARDVVLVDAGGTNIGSVRYALERLGVGAELSSDAKRISRATHVVLPGVGAAAPGMASCWDCSIWKAAAPSNSAKRIDRCCSP